MQNELQACSDDSPPVPRSDGSTPKPREPGRAHTLPMFPQQRLRRRRASRANMVRRVIFVGDRHQLDPALTAPEFTAALRAMEVAFDVIDKSRVPEWGDYRDADLVLALRPPGTAVRLTLTYGARGSANPRSGQRCCALLLRTPGSRMSRPPCCSVR